MDSSQDEAFFGRWLRKRRRTLDLTQKALARRVGCSPETIRKVEADKRHPSRHLAGLLGTVLGVPQSEMEAFVRFARGGWTARPPDAPRPEPIRPWLAYDAATAREPAPAPEPRPLDRVAAPPAEEAGRETGMPPDVPRLVARDAELRRMGRELEGALAGDGRTLLIAGEAGMGKTALMRAFACRAQADRPELLLALGACNAYSGGGDPFLPVRQILAQLTGDVPTGPHLDACERERRARLGRHMPRAARTLLSRGPHLLDALVPIEPLGDRLQRAGIAAPQVRRDGSARSAGQDLGQDAERSQEALRSEAAGTILGIADGAPLLLLFEDLHWIDQSSAELLLHLARAVPGHPLLLVGAYRPDDLGAPEGERNALSRLLPELVSLSSTTTIDLARADGRAFIEAWLDDDANDLDDAFRDALMRQTGGHPLFTIELLRAMQARGDVTRGPTGRWTAAAGLRWDMVPERIADALAARIEKLGATARAILRVASVEGEDFTAEVVAETLDLDPRLVVSTLGADLDRRHRLVAALDVTRAHSGLVSTYRFRHNLIQRHVYDGIDEGERAYLHESVATALERLLHGDADPVALAFHYTRAHAPDRAASHYRKAGDRARKAYALDQAIAHYQAALERWPERDGPSRAALLRALGESQWLRLQLDDARDNLTEARDAFEAAGDVRAAGAVQRVLALIFRLAGDYRQAFEAARHAVAMLEQAGESTELAIALSTVGYTHNLVSEFTEGAAWGRRAVDMAERVDARGPLLEAMICVGTALPHLDPPRRDEGVALLERSVRMAGELGQAREACLAEDSLANILEGAGRHRQAADRWLTCQEHARRHQIAHFEYQAQYRLWWHAWAHGAWSRAFELMPGVTSVCEGAGLLNVETWPSFAIGLAWSELDIGRVEQARAILDRHREALRRLPRTSQRIVSLAVHLRAAAAEGDLEGAERAAASIAEAVIPSPPTDHAVIPPVLEAVRVLERRSRAEGTRTLAACLSALTTLQQHYGSAEAEAALKEARASTAATPGSCAEVAALWTEVADLWQTGAFPLREARARTTAARTLLHAGCPEEAEHQQRRARTLLSRLAEQIPDEERRASFVASVEDSVTAGDHRRSP